MTEELKDSIGQIFWFAIFVTPFLTIPLVWKFYKGAKVYRIIIGFFLAVILSFFFYFISLATLFRDGMGPS